MTHIPGVIYGGKIHHDVKIDYDEKWGILVLWSHPEDATSLSQWVRSYQDMLSKQGLEFFNHVEDFRQLITQVHGVKTL